MELAAAKAEIAEMKAAQAAREGTKGTNLSPSYDDLTEI